MRRLILRLLLMWALIWPLVMVGIVAVEWAASTLPFAVRTLMLTGVMVPVIALGVAPWAARTVSRLEDRRARR